MTGPFRAVVVPPVPALLPEYASRIDPVAELRSAATRSVRWLASARGPVVVLWSASPRPRRTRDRGPADLRVAQALLDSAGYDGPMVSAPQPGKVPSGASYLVMANGCAEPAVRQPAPPDPRSAGLDDLVDSAVRQPDPASLQRLDSALGEELFAAGIPALQALGALLSTRGTSARTTVRYDAAPYLIRYWVAEITAADRPTPSGR